MSAQEGRPITMIQLDTPTVSRIIVAFIGICPECAVVPGKEHELFCHYHSYCAHWNGWHEAAICAAVMGTTVDVAYPYMRSGSVALFTRWRQNERRTAEELLGGLAAPYFGAVLGAQLFAREERIHVRKRNGRQESYNMWA